jgi:hypothetical protein
MFLGIFSNYEIGVFGELDIGDWRLGGLKIGDWRNMKVILEWKRVGI